VANHFLPLMRGLVGLTSLSCGVAGWMLLRGGAPTTLRLWLAVSMAAWCLDMLMTNVLGGGRYSLGWYAGKLYGFSAAGAVLVVYIIENGANYARLARLSASFEELARRDGLTGLCNRRTFDDYLATQYRLARREGRSLALVMCDIDHFKAYNDLHGHVAGDDCLRRVAQAVQSCCRRPTDLAARYGGEEFALILPETDQDGAMRIAEMARQAVWALQLAHGASPTAPFVTISLGVAISPDVAGRLDDTPTSLIEAADEALFHAKRGNRNRVAPPMAAVGSPTS
jgi:diguanylate cyclase (GGDEF)-like protein